MRKDRLFYSQQNHKKDYDYVISTVSYEKHRPNGQMQLKSLNRLAKNSRNKVTRKHVG